MKRSIKRALLRGVVSGLLFLVILGGLVVLLVGPWPVYTDSEYQAQDYFARDMARIEASLALSAQDASPARLMVGWAEADITPPVGTPLGGYSGRPNEKRCTGVHDPVFARAIALSDGTDTAVLVGTDLLMITLNIAEKVWGDLAEDTPFNRHNILFTASHSHCSPGGFAPGLVAEYSLGKYDPAIEQLIAGGIISAIRSAYASMSPGKFTHASVDAPEYILNRTNVEGEDAALDFILFQNERGEECYALRYSAHPTNQPETFMEVSASYPGALCRVIRERTGAMAVFLGGAVGAMGPDAPEKKDSPVAQMEAMGQALAEKVLGFGETLVFQETADVRSLGTELEMPPMQARPLPEYADWRFSPFFANIVGIPREGWIQCVQLGEVIFLGMPYDAGGAISAKWKRELAPQGVNLWVSGHCVAYCGYLSPDEYYFQPPKGYDQFYEWYLMNWFGPDQEAMFTEIKDSIIAKLKT